MKAILSIFYYLIIKTFSILPTWNLTTSSIDLLKISNPYTYQIDHRNWYFDSSDELSKTIKRDNDGNITYINKFAMYGLHLSDTIYTGTVDFEAVESFYNPGIATNNKIGSSIICIGENIIHLKLLLLLYILKFLFLIIGRKPINWT